VRGESVKITKRRVDEAKPKSKAYYVWDSAVPGFGLRVYPSGTRMYIVRVGLGRRDRRRQMVIGEHGSDWLADPVTGEGRTLTVDLARAIAIERRTQAEHGHDPVQARQALRDLPTLKAFIEQKYLPWKRSKRSADTVAHNEGLLRAIYPRLGSRRMDQIGPEDIEALHVALDETPTKANHCVRLLSHVFNLARKWRALPPEHANPCTHVDKYPEQPVERRLSDQELARAGDAMAIAEDQQLKKWAERDREKPVVSLTALAALRLIIFTGARPSEICRLEDTELDIERKLIVKRGWKTRGRTRLPTVRVLPLSAEALIILAEQLERLAARERKTRRKWKPWVFAGRTMGEPLTVSGLDGAWEVIRKYAKLTDVRVSDLGRHNFASVGLDAGYSLATIGRILGHTQDRTTARYAHLGKSAAASAVDEISARIAEAMGTKS
jgi:integrase